MEFLSEYGIFLAKAVTIVIAVLVILGGIAGLAQKQKKAPGSGHIEVRNLNEELEHISESLKSAVVSKGAAKQAHKEHKKKVKQEEKERTKAEKAGEHKKRVYVLNFDGDIKASGVTGLREEITAVLSEATADDEVVLKLESGGGVVHGYGLAASQLKRVTAKNIPLTVCIDKVAASGGYMMAAVANKIVAAPFAMLGSIGVVAQLPNFHRLLKKNDIDFEMLTAGEYKRTLTIFGENTEKGRGKFQEDLEDIHQLFKSFVQENRPQVDIDTVATGEVWFGQRALDKQLLDELKTSDEYVCDACENAQVYEIAYVQKKSLQERLSVGVHATLDRLLLTWWERMHNTRYYS